MATATTLPYRRVYVWELPVRVFHWVNAISIVLLAVTGFLIGWPQTIWMSDEPYQQYWFGWVRFIHFAAGYIFFFNLLFRVYWSFVGNEYARWSSYIPHRKEQFLNAWETLKVDILQTKEKGKISVGHNYLAALTYLGLFFVMLFQVVTGFGLYAGMSDAWLPWLFAWIVPLMGGDAWVRQWHHIAMWAFVVFTVIHVYLSFYHDVVEGRGTISAIVGGWKFERDDEFDK
ncbi:MAG: Ni/Fe-hydrogenase, b-type cytochrome subunit [Acidobacteria bacterium]|nr:Ni/Fe-hydrogenase, b-type cytochrome subunit [Acidobacteriota bacterium]